MLNLHGSLQKVSVEYLTAARLSWSRTNPRTYTRQCKQDEARRLSDTILPFTALPSWLEPASGIVDKRGASRNRRFFGHSNV